MGRNEEPVLARCANCGIEIEWAPTIFNGELFCCSGCARGGPCSCDYSDLPRHTVVLDKAPTGDGVRIRKHNQRR